MKNLRVGYWPLSANLKSAGDRRRVVYWAKTRGHTLVTDLSENVDVIIASERSDFNSTYLTYSNVPIIFDLVDSYLSPSNPGNDFFRGFAKLMSGQISGSVKPFSHHVRDFCVNSTAVICSSVEQERLIKPYNANTHVILDSHHEIPFIEPSFETDQKADKLSILWEGQPATINGLKGITPTLLKLQSMNDMHLNFVTDEKYFQFLNRYIERSTRQLLKRNLGDLVDHASIFPWSPDQLVENAKKSSIAIIPLDLSVPMQMLKPENRMLIMWRLGLPCLTSPSPAYTRVANRAEVTAVCHTLDDWLGNVDRLMSDKAFAIDEVNSGQNYLRHYHNETILLGKWDAAIDSVL
jgi:hypothetical protein